MAVYSEKVRRFRIEVGITLVVLVSVDEVGVVQKIRRHETLYDKVEVSSRK